MVGAVRRLGGRPRHLGRDRGRRPRRRPRSRGASGANVPALLDAAAPGLLVAQAIGRVGNWWNQELFGKPTDAAWGLEIDSARRPDEYIFDETFHPTFLYEALWNLGAAALLLVLDRRFRFRPPALFALYVALYTGFRFYLESLRIDPSEEFLGLRVNAWVAAVLFVASVLFFVWWQFLRGGRTRPAAARAQGRAAEDDDHPARPRPTPSLASAA